MIPTALRDDKLRFVVLDPVTREAAWTWGKTPYLNRCWNDATIWAAQRDDKAIALIIPREMIVVDSDNEDIRDEVFKLLPPTFTCRSGSNRGNHYYYYCLADWTSRWDDPNGKRIFDVQGKGMLIIVPPSKHKSGGHYSVIRDIPIAYVTREQINNVLQKYAQENDGLRKTGNKKTGEERKASLEYCQRAALKVRISEVLAAKGIDTSRNPTMCPLGHGSEKRSCLHFDDVNGQWYCHHCMQGGSVVKLVKLLLRGVA